MAVRRTDRGELRSPVRLRNGWLKLDGFLTRTGVFPYQTGENTIRRELRLPEEVFKPESLASFGLVPVTDDHPAEFLDSRNSYAYSRGSVSEQVSQDGAFVRAALMVTDAALIAKLEGATARELSCGYVCDLEDSPGVTADGQAYDSIQRNIVANHVAIVPKGRAGPEARVRMDASAGSMIFQDSKLDSDVSAVRRTSDNSHPEVPMAHKLPIDGVEYEVPTEQVVQAVQKMMKAHGEALAKLDADAKALLGKLDGTQAKLDAAAEELKKKDAELKAAPEKLRAELSARLALETSARKVLGPKAKLDGLDAKALKAAVLAKLAPELKLEGRSDEYIQARFDIALEAAAAAEDSDDSALSRARVAAVPVETVDSTDDAPEYDADKSAEAMRKRNRDAWKTKPSPEAA